jgi:hypothetical protein
VGARSPGGAQRLGRNFADFEKLRYDSRDDESYLQEWREPGSAKSSPGSD